MKSKQEVIQEAWGETVYPVLDMDMKSWDEEGDGWYKHWKETGKVYRNFLNDHNKRIIDLRDDIININGWFWPKALDGIENNRGWTRIESEADLPQIAGYDFKRKYFTVVDGKIRDDVIFNVVFGEWRMVQGCKITKMNVTHYMDINIPPLPIF